MQKLLVTTDFSPVADAALDYASTLAQHLQAELILLHVANSGIAPATNFHLHTQLIAEKKEQGKKELENRVQKLEGLSYINRGDVENDKEERIRIKALLETGSDVVSTIEEVCHTHQPDLIIVGTHGVARSEEILIGSVTADLISSSRTPAVLAIPSHAKFTEGNRIVYAANYSKKDEQVLRILLDMVNYFPQTQIDYLHINTDSTIDEDEEALFKLQEIKSVFESVPVEALDFRLRHHQDLDAGIDEYLCTHPTDMLVMLTEHRNFFERLWHRSRAKNMSFHTKVPLLILKDRLLTD